MSTFGWTWKLVVFQHSWKIKFFRIVTIFHFCPIETPKVCDTREWRLKKCTYAHSSCRDSITTLYFPAIYQWSTISGSEPIATPDLDGNASRDKLGGRKYYSSSELLRIEMTYKIFVRTLQNIERVKSCLLTMCYPILSQPHLCLWLCRAEFDDNKCAGYLKTVGYLRAITDFKSFNYNDLY